jgi:hypothetical protein
MLRRKRVMPKRVKSPDLCLIPGEGSGPVWGDPSGHAYTELRELFFKLLRSFSPALQHDSRAGDNVPAVPDTGTFCPHGIFPTYHVMTPEQQENANEMYIAIGLAVQAAYNRGLDYGRDILGQLARGDIKIGDFEKPHRRCGHCGRTLPTGNTVCPDCHTDNDKLIMDRSDGQE